MNLEKLEREQRMLDDAAPHEFISYHIGVNIKHVLFELRFIKYLLIAILVMLIAFANHFLPNGWWSKGWLG